MKHSYNQIRKREPFKSKEEADKVSKEHAEQAARDANNQVRVNIRQAIEQFTRKKN